MVLAMATRVLCLKCARFQTIERNAELSSFPEDFLCVSTVHTSLDSTRSQFKMTWIYNPYKPSARSTRTISKLWVRRISRYPSLSPMHSLWSAWSLQP